MSDWSRVKLGEVCEVRSGYDYKDVQAENGKYPILGTGGILGYATEYRCPANSVIVGRKGTLNNPMLVAEPFWNIDTCFGVVPSNKIDVKYLYCFCQNFDFYLLCPAIGRPSTTSSAIKGIEIPLPPLSVQREIVARLEKELGVVDQMTKRFEKMAELADAAFKTELKEVFEEISHGGAETRRLGDVCEVRSGGDYKGIQSENGKYPIFGTGGILGRATEYRCPANSVIVGRKGTLNNPMLVTEPFWNIDTCFGIVPSNKIDVKYLYCFCQNFDFYLLCPAIGRPSTTSSAIKNIEIPLPSLHIQHTIVARLDAAKAKFEAIKSAAQRGAAECARLRKAILKEAFE